jgi:beta-mannosidase
VPDLKGPPPPLFIFFIFSPSLSLSLSHFFTLSLHPLPFTHALVHPAPHHRYGTPNGEPLVALGGGHAWAAGNEYHRFYTAGVGAWNWSTVVFDPWTQAQTFNPGLPVGLSSPSPPTAPYGPGAPSSFVSEFGSSTMSSFESMSGTLARDSWGLHGGNKPSNCTKPPRGAFFAPCTGRNAMAQRNWAADNLVWSYFGPALLNASGEAAFKGGLFQSQVAGALNMLTVVEGHRSGNYLGAIAWQLNEIWPTGGWGSLEYGSPASPGSLRGGRWKPMHYWFKSHLFAPVMSACGYAGRAFACYVSNARSGEAFVGTLTLTAIDLASGAGRVWATLPMAAPPGPGALAWATPNATLPNATTTLLLASLVEQGASQAFDEHVVHLTAPLNLRVQRATVTATPAAQPNADGTVDIAMATDAVALFVTLTCGAEGRFSDNAFLLLPSAPRTVQWVPFVPGGDAAQNYALLKQTLRVEDHSAYATQAY